MPVRETAEAGHGVRSIRPGSVWVAVLLLTGGCGSDAPGPPALTVEVPLHLENHLGAANVVGSEIAAEVLEPVEWRFRQPQPDWRPVIPTDQRWEPVSPVQRETSVHMGLNERHRLLEEDARLLGAIYIDVPGWHFEDWSDVEIRARASEAMRNIGVVFNFDPDTDGPLPFAVNPGINTPFVTDGSVQTYRLPLRAPATEAWSGTWTHLGIWFNSQDNADEASIEMLSIRLLPAETTYADARAGVRTVKRGTAHRRALYTHTPGRLEYRVMVPEGGRLGVGLGVLRDDRPVTFRVTAQPDGGAGTLLEDTHADRHSWAQHSVDLSHLAGRTITLALEAEADIEGSVALWAAPTLSGARTVQRPNVILYVIDGGGADHMSLYGYNRRTTPNIDRLAAEGAVFDRAYSNASWSKPSTASFMTSLQHSVLGGVDDFETLPPQAMTTTEHLHRAGYQTAVLTTNGYVGALSGFDRGADLLRDEGWGSGVVSSVGLHQDYWTWREAYPGEPYWVHFQTTDVHRGDTEPSAPFAGLFISPEARERSRQWQRRLEEHGQRFAHLPSPATLRELDLDPERFYDARRHRYDEGMAHQDYQLGKLVERLKAAGEWEHTLLIVGADHGPWHAGLRDPLAESERPMLQATISRIPLIFILPERIPGGQRFSQPVSMIDVLPTILDLVDVPLPEIMQGQSLAPLMLGQEGWEQRPVILDEFYPDNETGELRGIIEVVDDRWGASLLVNPNPSETRRSTVPLLLCDLWNDPYCRNSLHEERPDLVAHYTALLDAQFEAHLLLAQHFTQGPQSILTPEQLRTLRALGYIQ